MRRGRLLLATFAAALVIGCGGSHDATPAAREPAAMAHWRPALHVTRVVDMAGRRRDGRFVVAADGRLFLLRFGAEPQPFARGPDGYGTQPGPEPYIALSHGQPVRGAGCRFPRDAVYALEPQGQPGVFAVSRAGRSRRVVNMGGAGLLNGIAFDTTGAFGHRLLITATKGTHTTVFSLDCRDRVRTLTRTAPPLEGGIVVAPSSFGRFAGDLIAPDERSGRIWAITSSGRARLVARSGIPHGGDIGVESAGFAPRGFGPRWSAYLADRVSPGNAHPGDDQILRLGGRALLTAGVRAGDLIVAGEGGAQTVAVRCRGSCSVRQVADGPAIAHAEGHIVFAPAR